MCCAYSDTAPNIICAWWWRSQRKLFGVLPRTGCSCTTVCWVTFFFDGVTRWRWRRAVQSFGKAAQGPSGGAGTFTPPHSSAAPDGRRFADVYLPRWRRGAPLPLDFAVTSGLRDIPAAISDVSSAVMKHEDFTRNQVFVERLCMEDGFAFAPMALLGTPPRSCSVLPKRSPS